MILRHPIQCALVLEAVDSLRAHATAEEVFEAVAKEHPHIGRGTVYRNLQKLAEAGEIQKVEVPGGADRYDHLTYKHYHVQCEKCGRVFDVDMPYDSGLEEKVADKHGFLFTGHAIMFTGICPDCQKRDGQARKSG